MKVVRRLKLNEISVVDNPAQEGALARIMKRDTEQEPNMAKLTKAQAAAHGSRTFAYNLLKAEAEKDLAITAEFEKCVNEIRKRDKCNHRDALRTARFEYPEEFAAYQAG